MMYWVCQELTENLDNTMITAIKKYRQENNLSQQKMAGLLGIPRSRYQKWEDGISNPKHEDALIMENFLSNIDKKRDENTKNTGNLNSLHNDGNAVANQNKANSSRKSNRRQTQQKDGAVANQNKGNNSITTDEAEDSDWLFPNATTKIRHYNDSSMTEYPSGSMLMLKEIYDFKNGFIFGQNYVVEYGEDWNVVTKRIQKRQDGVLMGYSTNNEKYDDGTLVHQPIELTNLHRAWRILGYAVKTESVSRVISVANKK